MALNPRSSSKHNQMITRFIKFSKPANSNDSEEPPAKKQKLDPSPSKRSPHKSAKSANHELPNSDAEDGDNFVEGFEEPHKTDLESALPAVKTDAEAIEEYEAFKASQGEATNKEEPALEHPRTRTLAKWKSSIYVDAFNLALDTVLDEESHLFNEAELEVFKVWRSLSYESQYLYVVLLRVISNPN